MIMKSDVRVQGIRPEMMFVLMAADAVWQRIAAVEAVVTSCIEGPHIAGSRHFSGEAIDLRIWNLDDTFDGDFSTTSLRRLAHHAAEELRKRLTNDYIVLVEWTHIHVQYSPVVSFSKEVN